MTDKPAHKDLEAIKASVDRIERFLARAAGTPRAGPIAPAFIAGQYPRRNGTTYARPGKRK